MSHGWYRVRQRSPPDDPASLRRRSNVRYPKASRRQRRRKRNDNATTTNTITTPNADRGSRIWHRFRTFIFPTTRRRTRLLSHPITIRPILFRRSHWRARFGFSRFRNRGRRLSRQRARRRRNSPCICYRRVMFTTVTPNNYVPSGRILRYCATCATTAGAAHVPVPVPVPVAAPDVRGTKRRGKTPSASRSRKLQRCCWGR